MKDAVHQEDQAEKGDKADQDVPAAKSISEPSRIAHRYGP